MILQHILIYYSIIIIFYDPNNLLTACCFFFNIKKKILSNGTSYLGQKSGSTSLKYKNIKTERALLLNFVLLFAGGFSLTEFAECLVVEETLAMRKMVTLNISILNIFVMLWKKLQQNKNWRENPQKLWHNCYWNVKISSSISYNCYVSLFYCLRILLMNVVHI